MALSIDRWEISFLMRSIGSSVLMSQSPPSWTGRQSRAQGGKMCQWSPLGIRGTAALVPLLFRPQSMQAFSGWVEPRSMKLAARCHCRSQRAFLRRPRWSHLAEWSHLPVVTCPSTVAWASGTAQDPPHVGTTALLSCFNSLARLTLSSFSICYQ